MAQTRASSVDTNLSKGISYKHGLSESGARQHTSSNKIYTPMSQRMRYKLHLTNLNENNELNLNYWIGLVGPTWNTYMVSPLSNMRYDEAQLKWYAVCIRRELVNQIMDDAKNVKFDTKLSLMNEDDQENENNKVIQIVVKVTKNSDPAQIKYKGILLSADIDNQFNLKFAPLLICRGTLIVTRVVHRALSQIFDVVIRPLKISMEDLKWLSVLVCDAYMESDKIAHLDFEVRHNPTKFPLQISLPCSQLKQLWDNIHEPESDEILYAEVFDFYKYLNLQLSEVYGIAFDRLKLKRFRFPHVMVSTDGKLQVHEDVTAAKVCEFLKQIAITLDNPTPPLSVPVNNV